jgi:lipid-A-disaccharide synthase
MKYYVIAGEASGDLHGSNLLKAIQNEDAEADFRAWGGDLMKDAGAVLVKHYRDLAFMGFTEVLMNLKVILKNLRFCKEDILKYSPDVLILIDYPGFNLRMAEFAHQNNIRVFYYISPQIWAWKQNRVYKIRKVVDRMYVILPFEQAFYARFNLDVTFVGHPLLDAIETYTHDATFRNRHSLDNRPIIALLPGSRQQEISKMLPVMLESIQALGDYLPVIAGAPSIAAEKYQEWSGGTTVHVVSGETYQLLAHAQGAIVTSGTATLEAALFNVPEVVCYKGGKISYLLAKQLIKVKYISLVNLILDRMAVKELIQEEMNAQQIVQELWPLLQDGPAREAMLTNYAQLRQDLGGFGASNRAARDMVLRLRKAH